jgi:hypothetical protein
LLLLTHSLFNEAGGPFIVTSYDYDAPLDEYGFPSEPKYSHLQQLHSIIHQYSSILLNEERPAPQSLGPAQEAFVWGSGNQQLTFLVNDDPANPANVTFQGNQYSIPAWSVTILFGDQVLFNSATIQNSKTTKFHEKERSSVPLGDFAWVQEPVGPWGDFLTSETPIEQLLVTHDQTDYCWYQVCVCANIFF